MRVTSKGQVTVPQNVRETWAYYPFTMRLVVVSALSKSLVSVDEKPWRSVDE